MGLNTDLAPDSLCKTRDASKGASCQQCAVIGQELHNNSTLSTSCCGVWGMTAKGEEQHGYMPYRYSLVDRILKRLCQLWTEVIGRHGTTLGLHEGNAIWQSGHSQVLQQQRRCWPLQC